MAGNLPQGKGELLPMVPIACQAAFGGSAYALAAQLVAGKGDATTCDCLPTSVAPFTPIRSFRPVAKVASRNEDEGLFRAGAYYSEFQGALFLAARPSIGSRPPCVGVVTAARAYLQLLVAAGLGLDFDGTVSAFLL